MAYEPHPFSDEIHIEQLEVVARIGVPDQERANPQKLIINISFWADQQTCGFQDNIAHTTNYSAVAEETQNFVRHQSPNLIETLANRIAMHLLHNFRMGKVTVEVRKFALPDAKYVSATVTRTASVG